MSDAPGLVRRAVQLRDLRRYAEAEAMFKDALAQSPHDPDTLHELALCQYLQPQGEKRAISTIESAIAAAPNESDLHATRALILAAIPRVKDAAAAAKEATRLDPYNVRAWVALASSHSAAQRWADVEQAARQALALDPDQSDAATMLAHALRLQGKHEENAGQIAGMLHRDAEDDRVHAAAGWSALQQGRGKEAEKHFLEALRLDPNNDFTRQGLLESFRARNPVYRAYLRYVFFMQGLTSGKQWLVIIGLLFVPRVGRAIGGFPGLMLITLYWYFVVWVHSASALGNFLILFDRNARQALKPDERRAGLLVGLTLIFGISCTVAGLLLGQVTVYRAGDIAVAAAVPFAHVFSSRFPTGTLLFGGLGLIAIVGALVGIGSFLAPNLVPEDWPQLFYSSGLLCVVAATWLSNIPSLRRRAG